MKRVLSLLIAVVMLMACIPAQVLAANTTNTTPTVTIDSPYAAAGQSVDVSVSIKDNVGIYGAILSFTFPTELTLTGASKGSAFENLDISLPDSLTSPYTIFCDGIDKPADADGVIITLSFTVSVDAEPNSKLPITVTYSDGDVVDSEFKDLDLNIVNGNVTVIDYIPGDVNGDGRVNTVDVTWIRRYRMGGYESQIPNFNEAAADVNDDGRINTIDVTLIRRYRMGGYGVELKPSTPKCKHLSMEATAAKAANCTETGNIAYWYCPDCDKYYKDAAGKTEIALEDTVIAITHVVVTDPAVAPTYTSTGLTEGSHCSLCEKVIVAQQVVPILTYEYSITYNIAGSDSYLAAQNIDNTQNPKGYDSGVGTGNLIDLEAPAGYTFLGWYDAPQENKDANQVKKISADSTGNEVLYAHWQEIKYTVTYKLYQTPLGAITDEKYLSYTVSKGLVDLPNPELYNYVFLGWYTDEGTEVTSIPAGSTEDKTLNAYWTSKRNLTKAVSKLKDPIIVEDPDNGVIYYTYEIGTIENVPLTDAIWTIQSVAGLAQQKSETVSKNITTEQANDIANTISSATVDSKTWTLSENWNDVTSVNESWAEENGMTVSEAETKAMTSSNTYSVSSSSGGSKTKTTTDGTTTLTYDSKNETVETGSHFDVSLNAGFENTTEVSAGVKFPIKIVDVNAGIKNTTTLKVDAGAEYGNFKNTTTNTHTGTDTTKVDTTVDSNTSTWNSSSSASSTQTASQSNTTSKALSQVVSNTKGYGKSYSYGGSGSESLGASTTASESINTSSTLVYSTSTITTTTSTYSTDGKSEGCYRLVIAGKVHVFGVVGYDVASRSYFTYTFNVMDDKTYEFLDYSPTLSFDDYENGAIPFEIPYFVNEDVSAKIASTKGLLYRTDSAAKTATVVGYQGTNTDVTIPPYISSSGVAYKVTGLSASAFAGKQIRSVILSEYITELPDGAFKDCTALEQISGYYTVIGNEAFSGCTSLEKYTLSNAVTKIGKDAFVGVGELYIGALNADSAFEAAKVERPDLDLETDSDALVTVARTITQTVIDSAINSGAERIVLNISDINEGTVLDLNVPEIAYFEIQGGQKTYNDLKLVSKASETVLKEITVINTTGIPLDIASGSLKLEASSVEARGFVLLLSAEAPDVTLIRDSRLISTGKDAIVWRDPTLVSTIVDNAVGVLNVSGNVYVCGEISGVEHMSVTNGEIIYISESDFEKYIKGIYTVTFDAAGGETDTSEISVFYNSTYGTLPIPTRDYYHFDGWFTENGTQITSESVMTEASDVTLYAHWTLNSASGWTLASEVPAGAETVNEKWTYDLTTNITSSNSSVDGYTLYDSTWEWGSYGGWSGWSSYAVSSSDYRQVETTTVTDSAAYTSYYYYIWRTNDGWGYGTQNYYTGSAHGSCVKYDEIYLTYALPVYNSSIPTYGPYNSSMFSHSGDSYWFYGGSTYVPAVTHTEYRYRDRSKVYTYYLTKTEAKESTTEITASSTVSNVQKWVQYRAK